MNRLFRHVPLAFCLSLTLTLGFLLGFLASSLSPLPTVVAVREEHRSSVPVITIERPAAGYLKGRISGEARVLIGQTMQVNTSEFTIAIPEASQRVKVVVPEGMTLVASKKGTNFYSVFSPAGEKIAPENRVYFRTEADALAAGLKKGS